MAARPQDMGGLAYTWMGVPALWDAAIPLAHRFVEELAGPDETLRPLEYTRAEFRSARRQIAGGLMGLVGKALVTKGDRTAGLKLLEEAMAIRWNPVVFRTAAEVRLQSGDTAGAMPALVRLAVDPETSPSFPDSARVMLGRHFDSGVWARHEAAAREDLKQHLRPLLITRRVPSDFALLRTDSSTVKLSAASERGTLVAIWSRWCPPSRNQLRNLMQLSRKLSAEGVRVLAVTDEGPSESFDAFISKNKIDLPIYHDTERSVRVLLDSYGTPSYVVLDGEGVVRFKGPVLEEVDRQVWFLRTERLARGAK